MVALVDGVELDRATVTVTTLGAEFLRDVTGTCTAADFPTMDKTVTLAWQQTQQNFVIVDGRGSCQHHQPDGDSRRGVSGESGTQLLSEWDWGVFGLGV